MSNLGGRRNECARNRLRMGRTVFVVGCSAALAMSVFYGSAMGLGGSGGDDAPPEASTRPVLDSVGGLESPSRMAMADDGRVFVSDTKRGIVAVFNAVGERVGTLAGLTSPLGLALLDVEKTVETTTETCLPSPRNQRRIGRLERRIARVEERMAVAWTYRRRERLRTRLERCLLKLETLQADTVCTEITTTTTVQETRAYVGDDGDGSVRIFESGELVGAIGGGSGEFAKPNGIAVTSAGIVYVVDSELHRVAVYGGDGNRQSTFGSQGSGDGELRFPTDIALNESLGDLYVSDLQNGRVVVFGLDGSWRRNVTTPPNSSGDPAFFRAAGIGIDPAGNLYVADNALSCLVIMTPAGGLIDIIGYENGSYWTGDLLVPVDSVSDGNVVWVSSSGDGKINVYEAQ